MFLSGDAAQQTVTVPQSSSAWNASNGHSSNSTIVIGESSQDAQRHGPVPLLEENDAGEVARLVVVGFIFTIFIVAAIVGNFLVITAIVTERNLRKAGNNFVISLAVADALVACLVMTFAAVNDLTYRWSFGAVFCDIWQSADVMCCTASILNICAVSLDRYIHIRDPLRYRNLVTQRRSLVAVALIWVMSALLSFLPIHLGWHRLGRDTTPPNATVALTETNASAMTEFDTYYTTGFVATLQSIAVDGGSATIEEEWTCQLDLSPWYASVSSTVSFYIPCIVMIVIYARLYRLSQKHRKFMKSVSVTKGQQTPASSNLHISMAAAEPEEDEAACDSPATPGTNGPLRPPGSENGDDRSDQQQNSCCNFQSVPVVTISTRSSMLDGLNQETQNSSRHWSVGSSSVGVDSSTGKKRIIGDFKKTLAASRSFSDLERNGTSPTIREHGPLVAPASGGGGGGCYTQRQQSMFDGLNQEGNSRHWSVGSSFLGVDSSTGKRRIFGSNLRRAIAGSRSLSDFDRGAAQQPEGRPASVLSHNSHPPPQRQSDYKTAITVGCIIGIFLFCWGPFFIINIIGSIWGGTIPPVIFTCFTWLGYLNSCANPVIYGVTNVEFRRAFFRILMGSCSAWRQRRGRRRRRPDVSHGGGAHNPTARRSRPVWTPDNNNYREVRTFDSPSPVNEQQR